MEYLTVGALCEIVLPVINIIKRIHFYFVKSYIHNMHIWLCYKMIVCSSAIQNSIYVQNEGTILNLIVFNLFIATLLLLTQSYIKSYESK